MTSRIRTWKESCLPTQCTKLNPFYVMLEHQSILPVDMDLSANVNAKAIGNTATVDTIRSSNQTSHNKSTD